MGLKDLPKRSGVAKEYLWSVDRMYPDISAWNEDFHRLEKKENWLQEQEYTSKMQDPVEVKFLLDFFFSSSRALEKLYTYAHLRHDEDLSNSSHKDIFMKAQGLFLDFEKAHAWIRPAILHLSDTDFTNLLESKDLEIYKRFFTKIERMRKHTLSAKEEGLLALAAKPLSTMSMAFRALNNADFAFNRVKDSAGQEHEMSHGMYGKYIRSFDRTLRESAYKSLLGKYADYENTIAALLQGQVAKHVYEATARNYTSALQAALHPNNIDVQVYHNLIETVGENIDCLHRYTSLRKRMLGVDQLYFYDLYVPLIEYEGFDWTYERAKQAVVDSVAPLGQEYQTTLKKGLYEQNWVDIYENQKKCSGAYSGGCYDSYPYILLNYPYTNATLNDVFTLAHEFGHSMHTYKSGKSQSYIDSHYPIFVAEVASTFNEQLLLDHLIKNATNAKEKAYLLTHAIESIRATLFRQTLFAEFEYKLHLWAEKNVPITPELLREEYRALNAKYYGNDLTIDSLLEVECLRIPHFYYNFYVYQYATGLAAALSLFEKVKKDPSVTTRYLDFLSSGGSQFPLDLLRIAGVDMTTKEPIEQALRRFANLVEQLEEVVASQDSMEAITEN